MIITTKKEITVNLVSKAEAKALSNRDYNPRIWESTIESYFKYENVILYTTPGTIYETDLFVIYTLDSGLRFRQKISYSSCLSAGTTYTKCSLINDFITELHLTENNKAIGFGNTPKIRKILADMCKENEFIFFAS